MPPLHPVNSSLHCKIVFLHQTKNTATLGLTRDLFHVWSFPGGPHEPIATPQVTLKLYKVYPYTLYNGIGVDLIYSQNYMGAPMAYTPHRILVDWSFECQGGCYSWHGAPFDVPSNGHKNVTDNEKKFKLVRINKCHILKKMCINCIRIRHFIFCCKNHILAKNV